MKSLRRFLWALRQAWNSNTPTNSLHSPYRMQELLERERMRSDRSNSQFALLSFVSPAALSRTQTDLLARLLQIRIRATDDAGFLSNQSLGVLLPETSAQGAWKLAEDLVARFPAALQYLRCEVYTYPHDHQEPTNHESFDTYSDNVPLEAEPVGVGAGSDTLHGHDSRPTNGHTHANGHVAAPSNRRRQAAALTRCSSSDSDLQSPSSRPMAPFFVRPLPLWKRAIDIAVSGIALLVLSPLLVVVALAVKATSPGPVIFQQCRDTLGGRSFMIYKFRTMVADAENRKAALREFSEQDGPAFKIAKDPRITPIGRFLRSTSIDELPQLLNVLRGDMTLVGPRAMDSRESEGCEPWQRRRLDVTAGITCIWQVQGRSSVSFTEWMRMDLRYIQTRSATGDFKLLVQTVPAVVLGRGAC